MNKLLKRFLTISFASVFCLSYGIGCVLARESTMQTASVPRWGAWSYFSENASKTDRANGGVYLNTSPHSFAIYGQIYRSTVYEKDDPYKSLSTDINLSLGEYKFSTYKNGHGELGSYKAAISSSNYEPDVRTVTYKFNP